MFQTKVLATAIAALVASTHADRLEDTTEKHEQKSEFKFSDIELKRIPQDLLKGIFKFRQNETGDLVVNQEDSSDDESLFSLTISPETAQHKQEVEVHMTSHLQNSLGIDTTMTKLLEYSGILDSSNFVDQKISITEIG